LKVQRLAVSIDYLAGCRRRSLVWDRLVSLFKWLFKFWQELPEEHKIKVIKAIEDWFERAFRAYYRKHKAEAQQ
jgi:hypothetical protein